MIRNPRFTIRCLGFTFMVVILICLPDGAPAAAEGVQLRDFTTHWTGIVVLILFVLAYATVISEEWLHLRKSKPVMVAAGLIWAVVALAYALQGDTRTADAAIKDNLLEFAELFLFLLSAMTYINTMDERGVFDTLRAWLISRGFSLRGVFWITGLLAFFISPVADNLTTTLLMVTVLIAVGGSHRTFITVGCINIVVAANAGGAFSPFGDITTLMVWQKGVVKFGEFFDLFIPALVNWLVPAAILSLKAPDVQPEAASETAELRYGAWGVVGLFFLTIAMTVSVYNFLYIPPVLGMMTGLGLLSIFGYYLKRRSEAHLSLQEDELVERAFKVEGTTERECSVPVHPAYNIFKSLERAEWDTLMFFYGILLCVGGLEAMGYLHRVSRLFYEDLGATKANVLIGLVSAVIDNIPVMYAVLSMKPAMSHGHWLLVTLTAGVGGSLLSIGSAAGVAAMGQARGVYTFFSHLKWSWAIALGFAASIWVHFLLNAALFDR